MLERYSLRNYTIDEIYDILDSNGLSNLKSIDTALLRRVVNRLPDLKAAAGTNSVIDIIFDIVADSSLSIKRYYLVKTYKTDAEGQLDIDTTKRYEDSVDLYFSEKNVKVGTSAINANNADISYANFVKNDYTWGKCFNITDETTRTEIQNKLKKQLLSLDFSSIITKYISISKILNMYSIVNKTNDLLALFYQLSIKRNNFMITDSITYNNLDVSAMSVYAAWCWAYGAYNGLSVPEAIITNATTLSGISILREIDGLPLAALNLQHAVIDLGNGYTKTLGHYFTQAELQSYLVRYNYTLDTPITTVLSQYAANAEIISLLKEKIEASATIEDYNKWNTVLNANLTSIKISDMFGGATSYKEFIAGKNPLLLNYIQPIIEANLSNSVNRESLYKLVTSLQTTFQSYITTSTDGMATVITDENSVAGSGNLDDIVLLLNEFMSIYTQIYSEDFKVGYEDALSNNLKMLYTQVMCNTLSNQEDVLNLKEYLKSDNSMCVGLFENLTLIHNYVEIISSTGRLDLALTYTEFLTYLYQHFDISISVEDALKSDSSIMCCEDNIAALSYVIVTQK
jgi:hypothetical protein